MTTEQVEQTKLRPFHETIVEAIERAAFSPSAQEWDTILRLLASTKIPAGHDKIVRMLRACFENRYDPSIGETPLLVRTRLVKESLLAQKRAAEAAASDVTCSFQHGGKERVLMIVIEKIISIIQNWRQPSPQARDKVTEIFKLFETAKRIYRASDEAEFKLAITEL